MTVYEFPEYPGNKYEYLYTLKCFKVFRIFPDEEHNERVLVFKDGDFKNVWMQEVSQINCEIAMFDRLIDDSIIEYCEVAMEYIDRLSKKEEINEMAPFAFTVNDIGTTESN